MIYITNLMTLRVR